MSAERASEPQVANPELLDKLKEIQRHEGLKNRVSRLFGTRTIYNCAERIVADGSVIVMESYGDHDRRNLLRLEKGEAAEIIDAIHAEVTSKDGTAKAIKLLSEDLLALLECRARSGRYILMA